MTYPCIKPRNLLLQEGTLAKVQKEQSGGKKAGEMSSSHNRVQETPFLLSGCDIETNARTETMKRRHVHFGSVEVIVAADEGIVEPDMVERTFGSSPNVQTNESSPSPSPASTQLEAYGSFFSPTTARKSKFASFHVMKYKDLDTYKATMLLQRKRRDRVTHRLISPPPSVTRKKRLSCSPSPVPSSIISSYCLMPHHHDNEQPKKNKNRRLRKSSSLGDVKSSKANRLRKISSLGNVVSSKSSSSTTVPFKTGKKGNSYFTNQVTRLESIEDSIKSLDERMKQLSYVLKEGPPIVGSSSSDNSSATGNNESPRNRKDKPFRSKLAKCA